MKKQNGFLENHQVAPLVQGAKEEIAKMIEQYEKDLGVAK